MILRYIYTFFLGLLIAIFVGVGISVFYEQPTQPNCYQQINYENQKDPNNTYIQQQEKLCERTIQKWEEDTMQPYNRNVSMAALGIAIVLVAASFIIRTKTKVISDGVMLGGVFTLVYSMMRGFASTNTKYSFIVVTIALIIAIIFGYTRIIEPHEKKSPATK